MKRSVGTNLAQVTRPSEFVVHQGLLVFFPLSHFSLLVSCRFAPDALLPATLNESAAVAIVGNTSISHRDAATNDLMAPESPYVIMY